MWEGGREGGKRGKWSIVSGGREGGLGAVKGGKEGGRGGGKGGEKELEENQTVLQLNRNFLKLYNLEILHRS